MELSLVSFSCGVHQKRQSKWLVRKQTWNVWNLMCCSRSEQFQKNVTLGDTTNYLRSTFENQGVRPFQIWSQETIYALTSWQKLYQDSVWFFSSTPESKLVWRILQREPVRPIALMYLYSMLNCDVFILLFLFYSFEDFHSVLVTGSQFRKKATKSMLVLYPTWTPTAETEHRARLLWKGSQTRFGCWWPEKS